MNSNGTTRRNEVSRAPEFVEFSSVDSVRIYNCSLSQVEIKKSFCIGVMGNTGTFKGAGEPAWAGSDGGQWDNRSDITFSTGDSLSFDGVDDYVKIEWS